MEPSSNSKKNNIFFPNDKNPAGGIGSLWSSFLHFLQKKSNFRGFSSVFRVNQKHGFDCPSCAWPDPENAQIFEFCENGAKAVFSETTTKKIESDFFQKHSVSELIQKSDFWLEDQGRLTYPMKYNNSSDRYQPISWENAFQIVGDTLLSLDNPNEAVFYTSGRTSNEAAFLYQLFAREYGTNNLPDCSNMCHESSGVALIESIGIGKGTVSLEDFELTDLIFVIGQNPGTNHPRMLTELQKAAKRGVNIITINPLKESGLESFIHPKDISSMIMNKETIISSLYIQPFVGGDMAVIMGIIKYLFELEEKNPNAVFNWEFIRQHTSDFEALQNNIATISWKNIEAQSGISKEILQQAALKYSQSHHVIACWAMGVTQHEYAVATIQYIVNLLLLRGNIGKPGAGVCPVRGHSNVQGDRTVGITEKPKREFLERITQVFGFSPPVEHGYDVIGSINAMLQKKAKVFIGMGGNFAAASPDTHITEKALRNCILTVNISTKLNRSHLIVGQNALILPCLGRSETDIKRGELQTVTLEDSMSVVHASTGHLTPISKLLLSEPEIVVGMAKAALPQTKVPWDEMIFHYDYIRDTIEKVVDGFEGYNKKIHDQKRFVLKNSAGLRMWNTSNNKARFIICPLPDLSLPKPQLRLMTIRSHDQFNTTIYGMRDRYRGISGSRKVIFLNRQDMIDQNIKHGQLVHIISISDDNIERMAKNFIAVQYDIPQGCAATYFPESNVLIPLNRYAHKSRTPCSKFIPIQLKLSSDCYEGKT